LELAISREARVLVSIRRNDEMPMEKVPCDGFVSEPRTEQELGLGPLDYLKTIELRLDWFS
jgi:hypothetical protein